MPMASLSGSTWDSRTTAITSSPTANSAVWFVGARPDRPSAIVEFDAGSGSMTIVRSNPSIVDAGYVAVPRVVSFPTTNDDIAHAVYYPPANPEFEGPPGERPMLIVHIHGGPTSSVSPVLKPETVFWTSRGFGVVDVNYRGSTGFGRVYREKLEGQWGVVDVDDAGRGRRVPGIDRRG